MSVIRLSGVAFSYAGADPLFSDLSLELRPGWTAVAGPNGAGKSTLLKLLDGSLRPTSGTIDVGDLSIVRLEQRLDAIAASVKSFAEDWSKAACRLRARFGLESAGLERWSTLSGGERQRWQLAAALSCRPDVLLLDEPTNHLDAEAREHMVQSLQRFRGVGVVVAHDRAFLDALAERVVWLERGRALTLSGGYSKARAHLEDEHRAALHARTKAKAEQSRLREEMLARQHKAASADRAIGARQRIKGSKDSDARSVARKSRAEHAAAKHSGAQAQLVHKLGQASESVERHRVDKDHRRAIVLRQAKARHATLIQLEHPTLGPLRVLRDDRIRLEGPNGSGKTTLLKTLLASWSHPRERLLYLAQSDPDGCVLLDAIEALPPDRRGDAIALGAVLGVHVPGLLQSRSPSPGEARKLALAEGLAREVWCVVLDEPTNHLDVRSIERLEDALKAYEGALLMVTHDQALANATTHTSWIMSHDGALELP